jgi:hypothetical protein
MLSVDHPLPMVRTGARARIGFEHRLLGLLDLKKQRIVVRCDEKPNAADGTDAADANNLDCDIAQSIAVKRDIALPVRGSLSPAPAPTSRTDGR